MRIWLGRARVGDGRVVQPTYHPGLDRTTCSKTSSSKVPTIETRMEPRHPSLLEKKPNTRCRVHGLA
jgi:hypothetical protein